MNQSRLSINYARALLQWASDSGVEKEVYEQSESVINLLHNNDQIVGMLSSPVIQMSKKVKTLQLILEKCAPQLSNFAVLVAKNGRSEQLERILLNYQNLYREKYGILQVMVKSPKTIGQEQKEGIANYLKNHFNKQVEMEFALDPSLIGGFILTINHQMLDRSVKGELSKLRKRLTEIVQ